MNYKDRALAHVRKDMLGKQNPRYKHGMTNTPLFSVWKTMIARCTNKNDASYQNYGGRGISVCPRWLEFVNFYEDMAPRPEGMQLDRINNDGDYSPENCKWSTCSEQSMNRRGAVLITHNDVTMNLSEWAKKYHLHPDTLRSRLKAGIDFNRAITMKRHEKRTKAELQGTSA